MAFIKGHEFIVTNKLGVLFNIYLNEKKHIECIISNRKGVWKEKHIVFDNITESFHLDINNNILHMVSYSENGKVYYHRYYDGLWTSNLITEYPIGKQKIIYPIIKSSHNGIHIFYYLLQSKEKNKAHLLHISFKGEEYNANHIASISFNKYINPFKVFLNKNELLVLYTSMVDNFDQIFFSKSDINEGQWSKSICLTSSKDQKLYMDGLLYDSKTLHLIWSKYDEEYLTVQYSKLNLNDVGTSKLKVVPISSESSCSFPTLAYYHNILWAIWTEMGKIVSSYSGNLGDAWSKPYIHEDSKKVDFKRYRYISSSKTDILCDFLFGTLYPQIQFLGFGGEDNDEIPTD